MSLLARQLQVLEAEQRKFAQEALQQPAARDSFEYGRICGIYAGLQLAREVLEADYAETERRKLNF